MDCFSALASIASRPASVTIAIRPSVGRDGVDVKFDLGQTRKKIFLKMGLDGERKSVPPRGAHSKDRHLLIDALEKHLLLRDHMGSQQLFDPWRTADIFA